MVIEDLEQLWQLAHRTRNAKLKGLINRLKYSDNLEDRIPALASIIHTLRRKRIRYGEHFLRHCLFYL